MSKAAEDTTHFEVTYRCLDCNETWDAETDRQASLSVASECPLCGTEDAVMMQENRTQTKAVDMDVLSDEEYRFVIDHCVGEEFVWEERDRIFEAADFDPDATETVEGVEMEFTRIKMKYLDGGSAGSQSIDDFWTNVKAGNYKKIYGFDERVRASQFYVIRVVNAPESANAEEGDIEFSLTDAHRAEGSTMTSSTPTPGSQKKWEVVAGPFDCPRMPHVLALERWIGETKPEQVTDYVPDEFFYENTIEGVWRSDVALD